MKTHSGISDKVIFKTRKKIFSGTTVIGLGCLFSFLLMFMACSPYYYAPSEAHMLGLSDKGDLNLSGALGGSDSEADDMLSAQLGYSPLKHIGLVSSYMRDKGGPTDGFQTEGGIGAYYFFDLNNSSLKSPNQKIGLLIDAYGGYGFGKVHNEYSEFGVGDFKFEESYFQMGCRFQYQRLTFAYAVKLFRLDYKEAVLSGEISKEEFDGINQLKNGPFHMLNHTWRIEYGDKIRIYFSRSWLKENQKEPSFNYLESSNNIGVLIRIGDYINKKS